MPDPSRPRRPYRTLPPDRSDTAFRVLLVGLPVAAILLLLGVVGVLRLVRPGARAAVAPPSPTAPPAVVQAEPVPPSDKPAMDPEKSPPPAKAKGDQTDSISSLDLSRLCDPMWDNEAAPVVEWSGRLAMTVFRVEGSRPVYIIHALYGNAEVRLPPDRDPGGVVPGLRSGDRVIVTGTLDGRQSRILKWPVVNATSIRRDTGP